MESSLVSALCSEFSVNLCQMDFRNPSFLWESPVASELGHGQKSVEMQVVG
jgi:hypothetical protein